MRIPADLHPDDRLCRQDLVDTLTAWRIDHAIPRAQVGARLGGITPPAVKGIEDRITWEAPTIMAYARAIGWRIEWAITGLVVPDDDDVMATILAAGDTSTPERADRVHWRSVCYDLVRIRRAQCTAVEMGIRCRIHENAVHHWEANPDGSTVIAAQRHARALGGTLDWRLHELIAPQARTTAGTAA